MLAHASANTVLLTLGVGIVYLLLVRFLDLNEKEPLWAIAMLFVLGAGAALVLTRLVSSSVLELTVFPAAAAKEAARFAAILGGIGVLTLLGQRRGWSEIDGVMDGLVYGASGGLGFATADVLIRDLSFSTTALDLAPSVFSSLARAAVAGLADGVFGAIIGAGLAAALHTRQTATRAILPAGAYGVAVVCHAAHIQLSQGNALGGTQGLVRSWIGLGIPVVLVMLLGVSALGNEKRAIRDELGSEQEGGVVTAEDFELLTNVAKRQGVYLKALFTAKLGALLEMRSLHNRQVQLALAKKRAAESEDARVEVERIRAAVLEMKRSQRRS